MKATLIRETDAPRFELQGALITGYASPSRGSAGLCTWRVRLPAGMSSRRHSLEVDEVFLALRGEAVFAVEGEQIAVRVGDGITVPAGLVFQITAVGTSEPFEAVACVSSSVRARVEGGEAFVPPWAL